MEQFIKQLLRIQGNEWPPHSLMCECKSCTIKPKHYSKALKKDK